MKVFTQSIIIVAGASIGLTVGFVLRNKLARTSDTKADAIFTNAETTKFSRAQSRFGKNHRTAAPRNDSPLATKLGCDLSMSSGVTRWLYWLEALEKATPADYPRLAQLAKDKSTLVRLLGERWAEMNPQHMFDILIAKQGADFPGRELQRLLFKEWSKKDMDAAVAALDKGQGSRAPESWRRNFATSLFDENPEQGLRLMADWHIDNYGPQMSGIIKWAATDPRHAAEFAMAHPAGYASRMAMETIGKEWAKTDPAGALAFALQHRGGFSSELAGAVLKGWTDRDLNAAADWLTKADAAARNRLSPAFVEGWAKDDAPSALKWCEENLTGITFANAAASLVKGTKDLNGAAELVNGMSPSVGRGEAATVLMQKWLPDYNSGKGVPPEATDWLARLDSETIHRVLEQTHWQWANADYKGLATFVASLKPDQVPQQAYSTLARNMARENPQQALDWASRVPSQQSIQIGNEVFSEWRRSQPEAAINWLGALPSSDERRPEFFEAVVRSIAHDPQATTQLAGMSAADRVVAEKLITGMSIPEDRRALLLNVLKPN